MNTLHHLLLSFKGVTDILAKHLNKYHCYASVFANIPDLMNLDWKVKLCHSLGKENASADFLVKWGSSNDIKWKLWNTPHMMI